MNIVFKVFSPVLSFLVSVSVVGCAKSPETESLGSITLGSSRTSSLAFQIPKSNAQPYRLQFESPGAEIDRVSGRDSLEVFLENDDTLPLVIYLNSNKTDVTIGPKSSERIFTGTFKDLLLAGRTEYEDLTIRSSRDRKVNSTLRFVRLSGADTLTVSVRAWRISYGP